MATPIYSITPFTLLDYPGKAACILWFAGCNMRCPYCYNPEIVLGKGQLAIDDALRFTRSRQGLLEGVVLSGGECTLHPGIFPLLEGVKRQGFLAKVDTNGSRPAVLAELVDRGLVDHVALDFKAMPTRYRAVTRSGLFPGFAESLSLLIDKGVSFEVRTTVHSALIDASALADMSSYLQHAGYRGHYYVQHAVNDVPMLGTLPRSAKQRIDPVALSNERVRVAVRG